MVVDGRNGPNKGVEAAPKTIWRSLGIFYLLKLVKAVLWEANGVYVYERVQGHILECLQSIQIQAHCIITGLSP